MLNVGVSKSGSFPTVSLGVCHPRVWNESSTGMQHKEVCSRQIDLVSLRSSFHRIERLVPTPVERCGVFSYTKARTALTRRSKFDKKNTVC